MLDTTSFATAKENMHYDETQFAGLNPHSDAMFFRFYRWPTLGVTQSEKRPLPNDLLRIDHAFRITGGGIVFHCPGDIVFSHAASVTHPLLPRNLKDRCLWLANLIRSSLVNIGIPTTLAGNKSLNTSNQNIMFCNAYHNPYECLLDDEKVCGIALKKTRSSIVFQGSIHLQATSTWFSSLQPSYGSFFTKGCSSIFDPLSHDIMASIYDQVSSYLNY